MNRITEQKKQSRYNDKIRSSTLYTKSVHNKFHNKFCQSYYISILIELVILVVIISLLLVVNTRFY